MSKKKNKAPELDPQGWMLSFSDLLTNLLTFFVLLYSLGSMNNLEFNYYLGSLHGALGVLGDGKFTGIGKPKFIQASSMPSADLILMEDAVIQALMIKSLTEDNEEAVFSKNIQSIEVYADSKYAKILFPARILFPKDSAEIPTEVAAKLKGMIEILNKFPYPIRINGYSHQIQSPSVREANRKLSLRRAAAVLNFFLQEGKLSPERCSLAGYGSLRKDVKNKLAGDYVEIFIIKPTNYAS